MATSSHLLSIGFCLFDVVHRMRAAKESPFIGQVGSEHFDRDNSMALPLNPDRQVFAAALPVSDISKLPRRGLTGGRKGSTLQCRHGEIKVFELFHGANYIHHPVNMQHRLVNSPNGYIRGVIA